jgi:Carboxylesterase family
MRLPEHGAERGWRLAGRATRSPTAAPSSSTAGTAIAPPTWQSAARSWRGRPTAGWGCSGSWPQPALDGGPARHRSGTFGLEDQQAALGWVQPNAAAFGGDPRKVMAFGQSSGAGSVCAQLVASAAAGLFDRVIVQSEPCTMTGWPQPDGTPDPNPPGFPRLCPKAVAHGLLVAEQLGCADPATAAAVLTRYRVVDHGSPSQAWAAVVTDAIWARPMTQLNRGLACQPVAGYRPPAGRGGRRRQRRVPGGRCPGPPLTGHDAATIVAPCPDWGTAEHQANTAG